jgi:hypothetical protein
MVDIDTSGPGQEVELNDDAQTENQVETVGTKKKTLAPSLKRLATRSKRLATRKMRKI